MKARLIDLVSESALRSEIDPDGGWVATTADERSIVDAFDPVHGNLFQTEDADAADITESPVEIDEVALRRITKTAGPALQSQTGNGA